MINVIKQQESSPFTSVEKSFEKNYILPGYYVYSFGTICKNLSLFLHLTNHLMISMLHAF